MKETRVKEALPITEEQENILWSKGLLGVTDLLDTIILFCGLCFALRSGGNHHRLS